MLFGVSRAGESPPVVLAGYQGLSVTQPPSWLRALLLEQPVQAKAGGAGGVPRCEEPHSAAPGPHYGVPQNPGSPSAWVQAGRPPCPSQLLRQEAAATWEGLASRKQVAAATSQRTRQQVGDGQTELLGLGSGDGASKLLGDGSFSEGLVSSLLFLALLRSLLLSCWEAPIAPQQKAGPVRGR